MTSTIKIKRSSSSLAPSSLSAGELAYSFGAGTQSDGGDRLYFGTGTAQEVIGGKYFTNFLDHVPGTLTASSALLVDSNLKIDNFKVDNLDFDGNTISSTNTDGAVVIDPNGNGSVELNLANNSAALAKITGATAEEYRANLVSAADANAIPNKAYVDNAVSSASSDTSLYVSNLAAPTSDPEQRTEVNLATDNLNVVGTGDITVTVAKVGTDVTFTIDSQFDLDQDVSQNSDVVFNSVDTGLLDADNIRIDGNTISSTDANGDINITPNGAGEVVVSTLSVSDLTAGRVVFAGTSGALVDDADFTYNSSTDTLKVVGAFEADNVRIDGNTISSIDADGDLVLSPNGTGAVDVATSKVINVVDPTADQDAATKKYVDTQVSTATSAATLTVDADTGTIDVNLAADDLQLIANANGLTTSVARTGTDVAVTFALAQDIQTSASPTFVDTTLSGNIAVNGGVVTTTATTANLLNANATTVNFAGAATALTIGAITGTTAIRNAVTIGSDLTVSGDLIVNGTVTTVNTTNLEVTDSLIQLALGNTANSLDIGFFGNYDDGDAKLTGLFRDASDGGKYKLFSSATVAGNVVNVDTLATLVVDVIEAEIDGGTY